MSRTLISTVSLLAAALFALDAAAADRPVLSLSGAHFRPLPLAVAPATTYGTASRAASQELVATLRSDLEMSGLFEMLDPRSFLADPNEGIEVDQIDFKRWIDVGAEGLVKIVSTPAGTELGLFSPATGKRELYVEAAVTTPANARENAHRFADDIIAFYTGTPGGFGSRIAFAKLVGGSKQIATADWDGKNAALLTQGSINILPAWSPDGATIIFTSYREGNPDLFTVDVRNGRIERLAKRNASLVTGATFSPDGRRIAYAMSEEDGSSHIWIADRDGKNPRKLTSGFGINSSPNFSPDSRQIAFVSNRAGNPQIYVMSSDGGAPRRITFQGNYNQTPRWSPKGDLIAFTARDERAVFDIFTVDPATSKITRLTENQGNNEEPSFSPDGRLIAFTSTRNKKSQLFVMTLDGNIQRPIDTGGEAVFSPAWGPRRK